MAHNPACDSFPDIWQDPGPITDPNHDAVVKANELHGKVYKAARYILVSDFNAPPVIPEAPEDFPGNPGQLTDSQIAMMATVHGVLTADDREPTMGKLKPVPGNGDLYIDVGGGAQIVVDKRFVDATVAAVKEYTTQAPLFNKCFDELKAESVQGGAPQAQPPPAKEKHPAGASPAHH
jgi:hypothetical protein